MSKNIFISQPMNGRMNAEILEERERMLELAARKYHDIHPLETFFPDFSSDAKPLTYLGKEPRISGKGRCGRVRTRLAERAWLPH